MCDDTLLELRLEHEYVVWKLTSVHKEVGVSVLLLTYTARG